KRPSSASLRSVTPEYRLESEIFTFSYVNTRSHGAPHFGHALGDDPARIHSSGSFSGNVAKWPSGNGCVAMVQTERLFRVAFSSLTVCDTATSGASFRLPTPTAPSFPGAITR